MSSVAVIDYGMGNLHSIAKALQRADTQAHVQVTSDQNVMRAADRIVFPGVGSMRDCMSALKQRDLIHLIKELALNKPFLGICLGLQALLDDSEENDHTDCLGLIPGHVLRFSDCLKDDQGRALKVPHMGWNRVHQMAEHKLWKGIPQDSWFYFVHSYYANPEHSEHIAASSDYPSPFAAALLADSLFAVQFHPEKSQTLGLKLLANFLEWDPD